MSYKRQGIMLSTDTKDYLSNEPEEIKQKIIGYTDNKTYNVTVRTCKGFNIVGLLSRNDRLMAEPRIKEYYGKMNMIHINIIQPKKDMVDDFHQHICNSLCNRTGSIFCMRYRRIITSGFSINEQEEFIHITYQMKDHPQGVWTILPRSWKNKYLSILIKNKVTNYY